MKNKNSKYKVININNKIDHEGWVIRNNNPYKDKRLFFVKIKSSNFSSVTVNHINLPISWAGEKVMIKVEKVK